jgi:GH25 family lysozyme M1 (1,4-beta-N-acetylmuramidase)
MAVALPVLSVGLGAQSALAATDPPYVKAGGIAILGIDISAYQHPGGSAIDFNGVRSSGVRFVAVKVDEGGGYVNPWYGRDMQSARTAGMYVTGYHFARPRLPLSTAASDARAFLRRYNATARGTLPPMLDIEVTDGLSANSVVSWVRSWVSTVRSTSGRTPIIYTGGWFWRGYLHNPGGFSSAPLWMADYEPTLKSPNLTGDWTHSTFWQYTDNGRIRGIHSAVDLDWFHGSLGQLAAFANAAPTQVSYRTVTLRIGSTGAAVKALQAALHITADGIFGPHTEAAVAAYQRSHHLPVTGVVTTAMWDALAGRRPAPAPAPVQIRLTVMGATHVRARRPLWLAARVTRNGRALSGVTFSVYEAHLGDRSFTRVYTYRTLRNGLAFFATAQTRQTGYVIRVERGAAWPGSPLMISDLHTVRTP